MPVRYLSGKQYGDIACRPGMSFSEYIEGLRIEKAKEYLSDGNMNINRISRQAGYSSAGVFGRAFKRALGCTPSEYQTRSKKASDDE